MGRGIRNTLIAAASAIGLTGVLALGAAAPAQAFSPIYYIANCPGTAKGQQLHVRNWEGKSWTIQRDFGGTRGWDDIATVLPGYNGELTYAPQQLQDTVAYRFLDLPNGTRVGLNWTYAVYCYY